MENKKVKLTKRKLQVRHYPQISCEPFCVDVKDEYQALFIMDVLTAQHLFLFENKIIPDYSNVIELLMFDEDKQDWVDYYNEEEMDFDEFCEEYII